MKYLYSFLLIILLFSISCNRTKTTQEVSENSDSLKINSNRIVGTIGEILIPKAKKAVSEWKEYNNVDGFMMKYYNISNSEALDYAEELSELVLLMKDTIRVDKLKGLDVMARFNVLHNETLRLADMANIPSILNEEVKEEVLKIIEIYTGLNSKINTIYKAEALQNSLEVDTEIPIEMNEKPIIYKRGKVDKKVKSIRKRKDKPTISSKSTKQ